MRLLTAEIVGMITLALLAGILLVAWLRNTPRPAATPALSDQEVAQLHRLGLGYGPEQLKVFLELRQEQRTAIREYLAGHHGSLPDFLRSQLDLEQRPLHLNPASQLPPVDCPLLISVQGQLLRASRPTFAERKGDDLEYELTGGGMITGRFPWTYQ